MAMFFFAIPKKKKKTDKREIEEAAKTPSLPSLLRITFLDFFLVPIFFRGRLNRLKKDEERPTGNNSSTGVKKQKQKTTATSKKRYQNNIKSDQIIAGINMAHATLYSERPQFL